MTQKHALPKMEFTKPIKPQFNKCLEKKSINWIPNKNSPINPKLIISETKLPTLTGKAIHQIHKNNQTKINKTSMMY